MKTNLIFLLTLLFLASCSDNDDNGFPRKVNIEIIINASDNRRFTEIETIVSGINLELRTNSYSNTHLPYKKIYLNQEIPDLSTVNVSFRDNSIVPIGTEFEPYTTEITVEIDGEIAISEQYSIDEQGYVASTSLSLTEYFANK